MFFQHFRKRTGTWLHYIFRAGACTRICAHMQKGKARMNAEPVQENSKNTEKSYTEFFCTKAINRKNARKCRKRNHQSTIKTVVFAGGMTNKAPENSHRRHIFFRDSRYFLCFPLGKHMFPPWKTYVSRQRNIRLP